MHRFLVFSDLHGDVAALELLLDRMVAEEADHLICAGDVGLNHLGNKHDQLRHLPITFVRGNCDSPWIFAEMGFSVPKRYTTLELNQHTLFVTHGDVIPSWKYAPIALTAHDIFISGHTHVAALKHPKGSPILLNPGSVSSPRDRQPPSYAIITNAKISIKSVASGRVLHTLQL